MEKRQSLEIILKTMERCNINCSYCYFFHGEDKSYKKHPPFISRQTIQQLTYFLLEGIRELHLKKIQIDFHGGEPTLQKKVDFDYMCQYFKNQLGSLTNLNFVLQTNATLIDDEWIALFSKHQVFVGISIDGPKTINDRFRIDHRGLGTYDRTIAGLKKLQAAARDQKINPIAALSVINPTNSAKELYRHLVHELGIQQIDFLLPDYTYRSFKEQNPEEYGHFLCDLFHIWVSDDNPSVRVRILNSALDFFVKKGIREEGLETISDRIQPITVSSNGDLSPDDSLRSGVPQLMNRYSIFSHSLRHFLASPEMQEVIQASQNSPDVCKMCCWENVCGGGTLISRYSKEHGFNRPSVFCSGLQAFYTSVAKYVIANGISTDRIREALLAPRFTQRTLETRRETELSQLIPLELNSL